MFRKVLFMWRSMPIFIFTGCALTELFRKSDNWWQIYKQTSSTFYTSNDVSRRKICFYVIAKLLNSCLITFLKICRSTHQSCSGSHWRCSIKKGVFKKFCKPHRKAPVLKPFLLKLQVLSLQVFLQRDSSTSAFLWILQNF